MKRIEGENGAVITVEADGKDIMDVKVERTGLCQAGECFKSPVPFKEAGLSDVLYVSERECQEECPDFYTKEDFYSLIGADPESPKPWEEEIADQVYDLSWGQDPELIFDEMTECKDVLICPECGVMWNPLGSEERYPEKCPVCGEKLDYCEESGPLLPDDLELPF